jgi:hypothetical protein
VPNTSSPDKALEYANLQSKGENVFASEFFEFEGNTIHFVSSGEGDVVLFLHGFPSFWYSLMYPQTCKLILWKA